MLALHHVKTIYLRYLVNVLTAFAAVRQRTQYHEDAYP